MSRKTAAVCVLMASFAFIGACSRAARDVSSQDVDILRAVIEPDACTGSLPSVVLTEPALAKVPAHSGPLMKFGMDLASRRVGATRWPEFEICAGVKVAASSAVRNKFQVSLPVYSPSRKRAVVIVELDCGPLCGHGRYAELHEIEGVWKVTKVEQGWIS